MHILNNLKNYLYDKEYTINICNDNLYFFNYVKLLKLTDKEIILDFANFKLEVTGNNFLVYKMTSKDLLIKGNINDLRFIYAKCL